MKILLDDTPLRSAHAARGIGTYTRQLAAALSQQSALEIMVGPWKHHWQEVDLVHAPHFDFFKPTFPSCRKPIVVTIHDVIPLQFPEHYPVGSRGKLAFWRQKRALRRAKAVITDSLASKEAILTVLPLTQELIHTVPLAPDPLLHAPAAQAISQVKQRLQLPDLYLLYVGDINYNKNVPQLIKALKFLDEAVHLVLVGHNFREQAIPEWLAIERQIALSDVSNRVHFLTEIRHDDSVTLSAVYASSACYVQPSLAEGFGLPVLDALQVGVPVIASNRSSLPEVGGIAVHYSEPTAEAIAASVEDVLAFSYDHRRATIHAGQQHAAQFSWEKTAALTVKVYEQVLK